MSPPGEAARDSGLPFRETSSGPEPLATAALVLVPSAGEPLALTAKRLRRELGPTTAPTHPRGSQHPVGLGVRVLRLRGRPGRREGAPPRGRVSRIPNRGIPLHRSGEWRRAGGSRGPSQGAHRARGNPPVGSPIPRLGAAEDRIADRQPVPVDGPTRSHEQGRREGHRAAARWRLLARHPVPARGRDARVRHLSLKAV